MRKYNKVNSFIILLIVTLLFVVTGIIACKSVSITPTDEENGIPKTGRWRLARVSNQTEEDESTFYKLLTLGYMQGYNPAPKLKNVTVYNKDLAYNGFNFYTSGHAPEAFLVNMKGEILHTWHYHIAADIWPSAPKHPTGSYWRRAHLYRNGDLLAIYEGIGLIKINKDSNLLWSYNANKKPHHDIEVTEDGKIYILTRERKTVRKIHKKPILYDFITILNQDGKVIKHISLFKLIKKSPYAKLMRNYNRKRRDELNDLFHTNTIEVFDGKLVHKSHIFKKGNVMVSVLTLDTIFIVNMRSEKIIWALGSGMWEKQHQPTLLENGNILIFDNHYKKNSSRVIEFDPLSREIVWEYKGNDKDRFFSKFCGSNQRLPNGNTLITETDYGRVFEVTKDGKIVWEFLNPFRAGEENEWIATIPEMIRISQKYCLFRR